MNYKYIKPRIEKLGKNETRNYDCYYDYGKEDLDRAYDFMNELEELSKKYGVVLTGEKLNLRVFWGKNIKNLKKTLEYKRDQNLNIFDNLEDVDNYIYEQREAAAARGEDWD